MNTKKNYQRLKVAEDMSEGKEAVNESDLKDAELADQALAGDAQAMERIATVMRRTRDGNLIKKGLSRIRSARPSPVGDSFLDDTLLPRAELPVFDLMVVEAELHRGS